MFHWLHAVLALLNERLEAGRDAKIRFLKAEVQILRRKLEGNRVILDPKDRCHLLRLGGEFGHRVKDIIGIVSYKTYQRWVRELKQGKKPGKVDRPGIGKDIRELIIRIARDNNQWGYPSASQASSALFRSIGGIIAADLSEPRPSGFVGHSFLRSSHPDFVQKASTHRWNREEAVVLDRVEKWTGRCDVAVFQLIDRLPGRSQSTRVGTCFIAGFLARGVAWKIKCPLRRGICVRARC